MIWIMVVAVVAGLGVALLLIGLRGRRINDHPHCRGCGFDLVGLVPATCVELSHVCPECGRAVRGDRDVRIGTRVRQRSLIACGTAMLLVVAAIVGSAVWISTRGPAIYAKLPTPILRALIPYSSGKPMDSIGNELAKRIAAGTLSAAEVSRVVDAAIDRQRDEQRPWSTSLGGAVEAAIRDGLVSDAQFDRYCAGAVRLKDFVRETIVTGDEVPIRLVVESRAGVGGVLRMQAHLLDVILDDICIDGERHAAMGPLGGPWQGTGPIIDYILGPQDRGGPDDLSQHYPPARANVKPGPHTVTTVWAVAVGVDTGMNPMGGVGWSVTHVPPKSGKPPERTVESIRAKATKKFAFKDSMPTWTDQWAGVERDKPGPSPRVHVELLRLTHPVTVTAKDVEPVRLLTDAAVISAAESAVKATTWVQPAQPPWHPKPKLQLSIVNNGTTTIAGNIYWLIGGKREFLGSSVIVPSPAMRSQSATAFLPNEAVVPEVVELVIEPDPKVAHRVPECFNIVGGEIHLRIPIEARTRQQLDGQTPLSDPRTP